MASWLPFTFDLTTVTTNRPQELAPVGKLVRQIYVLQWPTGIKGGVVLGQQGNVIPLKFVGQSVYCRPPEDQGVFFVNTKNAAQVGKVVLAVCFETPPNSSAPAAFLEGAGPDELLAYALLASGFCQATGAVSAVARAQIINPVGSGILVLVQEAVIAISALDVVQFKWQPSANAGTVGTPTAMWRDRRQSGSPTATLQTDQPTTPDVAPLMDGTSMPASGEPFVYPLLVTLDQGQALACENTTAAATNLRCSWHWKEIPR